METIYKINEQHFTFVRMGNLPNATPLVSRFFGEMSNKRVLKQRIDVNLENSFRFLQSLRMFYE
jgi:hypothetical protein